MKKIKFEFANLSQQRPQFGISNIFGTPIFSLQEAKAEHIISTKNESLYKHLQGYLIFGRILGIIPLQGVFSSNVHNLKLRFWSLPYLISISITLLLTFCIILSTIGMIKSSKRNALELAHGGEATAFFSYALFIYIYFLRNSRQFVLLLQQWESVNLYFTKEDKKLRRHFSLIIGIIFSSAILENAVYHLNKFPLFEAAVVIPVISKSLKKKSESNPPLEVYYEREFPQWQDMIPYNPVLSILLFFANKFAIYAWNYSDILIALISRAFYFKFKTLIEVAEEQLVLSYGNKQEETLIWKSIIQDHNILCQLLEKFADFLSKIIFAAYSINIYIVCLLIHQALTPSANNSIAATLYSAWSFFQMTGRVFVFSLAAARVNEFCQGVRKLYLICPDEFYSVEVKRSEMRVSVGSLIALHGMKCFFITKEFLLKIISVVITFEIVLLQATPSYNVTSST